MHEEIRFFAQRFAIETKDRYMDAMALSTLLATFFAERNLLCDLPSISAAVLEHNMEPEDIRNINMSGLEDGETAASAITKTLGIIDKEQAACIAFFSGVIVAEL